MNRLLKMNRFFKSCLLASAGLVILAVTLSVTTPGRAFAQRVGEDCIRICDTASNPLHVIVNGITRVNGEVTINNENAIATTVSGPVQVTTSPREPLLVVQRLKVDDIFQKSVSLAMENGQSEVSTPTFVVPAGKILVIESAFGTAQTNPSIQGCGPWCVSYDTEAQHPLVLVKTTTDNSAFQHFLATMPSLGNLNENNRQTLAELFKVHWNVGGGAMQLYAYPGTEIEVIFKRPNTEKGTGGTAALSLTLSGHYIDAN